MCVSEVTVRGFAPILRLSVLAIRCDHTAAVFYGLEIKCVFVANGEEPNVFRGVLPVFARTSSLFPFPCDPILQFEITAASALDRRCRTPVTAYVNGSRRFQKRCHKPQP